MKEYIKNIYINIKLNKNKFLIKFTIKKINELFNKIIKKKEKNS